MSILSGIWSYFGFGTSKRIHGVQSPLPGGGRLTTRSITPDTAMQLSAVFACVRVLSETIASLPLKFYEVRAGGSLKLIKTHPLQKLLTSKPNRYQTNIEFFETLVFQLALHGNSYHRIDRNGAGEIISLTPYMTPQTQTILDRNGDILYKYQDDQGIAAIAPENMWHNKLFGNGVIGMSPLDYARNSLGIAISADDRMSKIANGGFKPSAVLMIDKILKPEQRKTIRDNFSDLVDGGDDALRILEAGMQYQQVSMNPKDVQFLESRRFQLEDIARFFAVPSVIINDTSATTVWGSGIQQIMAGFYKLGLRPYIEKLEASISIWLLKVGERRRIIPSFDLDILLRGDEETRYKTYEKAVKWHIKTPNECRRSEGMEEIAGGDDFPIVKSNESNNGGDDEKK